MKICFLYPPHRYLRDPSKQIPLGILYLVAVLRQKRIPVDFINLSSNKPRSIPPADLYGLTGTVLDATECNRIAKEIKKLRPTAKIILGGPISLTPQYVDRSVIDSIIIGEGEEIIFDIISDFPNLKNTYKAFSIIDLDSLPFPAKDLSIVKGSIFAYDKQYDPKGSTSIITSRGCTHN